MAQEAGSGSHLLHDLANAVMTHCHFSGHWWLNRWTIVIDTQVKWTIRIKKLIWAAPNNTRIALTGQRVGLTAGKSFGSNSRWWDALPSLVFVMRSFHWIHCYHCDLHYHCKQHQNPPPFQLTGLMGPTETKKFCCVVPHCVQERFRII